MEVKITKTVKEFARAKSPKKQFKDLFGIKPNKKGAQEAIYTQIESLKSVLNNPEFVDGPIKDDMTEKLSRAAVIANRFGYSITPPANKE